MNKGKFIVIDGTDGSGKATQTKLLVDRLEKEGYSVKTIDFPQYETKSASMVENYLLLGKYGTADEVGPYKASIFYACDRYDASFKIRKWLDEGNIVIADRYVGSNMAHQGGKIEDKSEREKYFEWNYDLEFRIFNIPKPDINFILHVKAEISQRLAKERESSDKRDIHESDINHLKKAEETYLELSTEYNEFQLIECVEDEKLLSIEDIQEKLYQKVKEIID